MSGFRLVRLVPPRAGAALIARAFKIERRLTSGSVFRVVGLATLFFIPRRAHGNDRVPRRTLTVAYPTLPEASERPSHGAPMLHEDAYATVVPKKLLGGR